MNKKTINGEEIFQIPSHSMTIGYSSSGYTLMYGCGGDFTAWETATPADEICVVSGFAKGTFFFLSGNTDTAVIIQY